MVKVEQTMEISVLVRQGKCIRVIAQGLGLSKSAVRKYPRQPEAVREYGPRTRQMSKLDPFKEGLRKKIADAAPKRIPAMVLLWEIRQHVYSGGPSKQAAGILRQRPCRGVHPAAADT